MFVHGRAHIPVVPHFGQADRPIAGGLADESGPIRGPLLPSARFVVNAVKHMGIFQRNVEQFANERLLICEQNGIVVQRGHAEKERLPIQARMKRIRLGEPGLGGRVIHIVFGVIRVAVPKSLGMIETIPNLDLDDNVPLSSITEQSFEPFPILGIPPVQIVPAVGHPFIGPYVPRIPVAHRIAYVIAPCGNQRIEMGFKIRTLEQIVITGSSQQKDRPFFVLPVKRILASRLNPF